MSSSPDLVLVDHGIGAVHIRGGLLDLRDRTDALGQAPRVLRGKVVAGCKHLMMYEWEGGWRQEHRDMIESPLVELQEIRRDNAYLFISDPLRSVGRVAVVANCQEISASLAWRLLRQNV